MSERLEREQPWHRRRAATQHYLWYRNLLDLHALTLEWLKTLNVDRPSYFLKRGATDAMTETLWMLEPMTDVKMGDSSQAALDQLLDDTSPDDLLGRLEHTVFSVQGWALSALLDRAPAAEQGSLKSQLEQSSWKAGRECATARWPVLNPAVREDVRGLLAAYRDNPLTGAPAVENFLIKRALPRDAQLELLTCPHQSANAAVRMVADSLCALQHHWTRGYVYALNTQTLIEYTPCTKSTAGTPRCQQRWILPS